MQEKGLNPLNGLKAVPVTPREGSLTTKQEARIRDLVRQGFSEHSARIEVLCQDHPIGCECEVCG